MSRNTRKSKFLSLVLRHQPGLIGLELDASGWASCVVLVRKARAHGVDLTLEELPELVAACPKQRFAMSTCGHRIRANQGHSLPVDLGLASQKPPALLYHGTARRFLDAIRAEGLTPQSRLFVHCAAELETARTVGARHGRPVILTIDAQAVAAAGIPFCQSDNGVWMATHIPPEYISFPPTDTLDAKRFQACWDALGATGRAPFARIIQAYSESQRAYHTEEHLSDCLRWLDRVRHLAERPDELEMALMAHDMVYDPNARDNEAQSAAQIGSILSAAGVPEATVARIEGLVLLTAGHDAMASGDGALMVDIDLVILGAPAERYDRFERDIRREYAAVNADLFRTGRTHILRGFLKRTPIFHTPMIAAKMEDQARKNLRRALAVLDTSPKE